MHILLDGYIKILLREARTDAGREIQRLIREFDAAEMAKHHFKTTPAAVVMNTAGSTTCVAGTDYSINGCTGEINTFSEPA